MCIRYYLVGIHTVGIVQEKCLGRITSYLPSLFLQAGKDFLVREACEAVPRPARHVRACGAGRLVQGLLRLASCFQAT